MTPALVILGVVALLSAAAYLTLRRPCTRRPGMLPAETYTNATSTATGPERIDFATPTRWVVAFTIDHHTLKTIGAGADDVLARIEALTDLGYGARMAYDLDSGAYRCAMDVHASNHDVALRIAERGAARLELHLTDLTARPGTLDNIIKEHTA